MNALDFARQYLSRGWKPVPIPLGSKGPKGPSAKGWGKKKVTLANVAKHFNGADQNVGIQFGDVSGGLRDVDLDCPEAVKLAAPLLPKTDAIFGRASKPASHYLYVTPTADAKASKQFRDADNKVLVELRMGGGGKAAQTLFPGSVHPSGEHLSWVKEGSPAEVPFAQLMAAVTRIAIGALLCRHWPGDGHGAALRVAGFLARSGWEAGDVAGFVGAVAHAAGDEHHRDHVRTARDTVESHARGEKVYGFPALQEFFGEKQAKFIAQWLNNEPEGTGPSIKCVAGEIPRMTTEAEAALIKAGSEIYVHGSQLVQPVIEECEAAHDRKTMVARLRPMTDVTMIEAMSETATWLRKNERGFWIRTDPPVKIAKTLQEREGRWHLPRVVGVITCPTLRPDGSLLAQPGYDPATKLLLVAPPTMPSIPERPTKAEAEAALARLDALLDEFPFADDGASRSVGLSMLLTTVARGAMMCAPGHVVTAPEAGTGKSFMIDIASTIATGRWCPVIAAGRNEEETEKRLGALLIKGQPLVSIDNVNGHLGGDLLCQMITQPTVEVRVLGLSKTISVDNRMTLFANGNNIKLIGDLVRRVVRCSMDADMERPETRKFAGNPIDVVLANRGKYIADALTVVRAFIVAERPGAKDLLPFLGFDGWNNNVRGTLVWLGQADPVDSVKSAREEDPGRATLVQVVEAIAAQNFGRGVTAGELAKLAEEIKSVNYGGVQEYKWPELHDALIVAVGDRGRIGANSLGKWLDRHAGRVVGGYKIVKEYDRKLKQNHWLVKEGQK